ncbi:MAG: hypothetical protein KA369_11310, partial [Spirochaetes bacterium]|nr:hypothetical protein [Spirochaetota bacterium]
SPACQNAKKAGLKDPAFFIKQRPTGFYSLRFSTAPSLEGREKLSLIRTIGHRHAGMVNDLPTSCFTKIDKTCAVHSPGVAVHSWPIDRVVSS